MAAKKVDFETEWARIHKGIERIVSFVELNGAQKESLFSREESMLLYSAVYSLCLQKGCDYDFKLYNGYKHVFQSYINSRVLPSLKGRKGEYLLREFVKKWNEHLFMVRCLTRFFFYLDLYFVIRHSLPSMKETAFIIFFDQVYHDMKEEIIYAVLSMINEDRDGMPIDGELVTSVIKVLTELKMDLYQKDFEPAFLDSSGHYYNRKSNIWLELSRSNYMSKVDECLKIESFKGLQYLHPNTVPKLIERIRFELVEDKLAKMVNHLQLGNN